MAALTLLVLALLAVSASCDSVVLTDGRGGGGSMKWDPIVAGFDGRVFEFMGYPGHNYSVLAHSALDVNALMGSAGPNFTKMHQREGTFMVGVSLMMPSLSLLADVDEAGNMTLHINGEVIDNTQERSELVPGEGSLTYAPFLPEVGQRVSVVSGVVSCNVTAVKAYTDPKMGLVRGHINLDFSLSGPPGSLNGIMGTTLGPVVAKTVDTLEGQDLSFKYNEDDFEVPSLLTRGFRQAGSKLAVARRLLETSFNYPAHARLY